MNESSDIPEKTSGFGIGELGTVPESNPENIAETLSIENEQSIAWHKHDEQLRLNYGCTENTTPGAGYHQCGEIISTRVYHSGTMGSRVLCEAHWIEYHSSSLPGVEKNFGAIMTALDERAGVERSRPKKCARCGSTDATWNSGAGEDLCSNHWDSY
ncbi:MAG TPA: hypothetical protein DCZ08_03560 [Anaerolineaceae bacterium]|nr:hypothetical protein [Anaerolineaceae bacterium]